MIDEMFDRQVSARIPADYPLDASSYAELMEHARRRQSSCLRQLMGNGTRPYSAIAEDVNALLGGHAVSESSLRNMRAGTSVMPPRVAVALADVLDVEPLRVLPHLEAFPWLGGRYRSELAGRTWGEIAGRFDVPMTVIAPMLRTPACPVDADRHPDVPEPASKPGISDILRSIEARSPIAQRRGPIHDPVPSITPLRADPPPPVQDDVMMSIRDVPGGIRIAYRGLMDLRRLQMVRDAVGEGAWSQEGAFSLGRVPGRTAPLFTCDMVVPRSRTSRLLAALGAPVPRKGFLARLLGR